MTKLNLLDHELITHLHPPVSVAKDVYEATSICVNGVTYREHLFVVFKVDGHEITFAKINKIYVINGVSWLWCSLCNPDGYNRHQHAYMVTVRIQKCLLSVADLASYYNLPGYTINNCVYIALRHRMKVENIV